MDETQTTCPHCGKPVAANLMGLCPQCMLKAGMATQSVGPAGERFVPPTVEELGRHFPALEIVELIGRGGMGAVYKARQRELDRVVALKILPSDVAKDATFAERFAREAKALAALSHPHIVTLYEYGRTEGLYYFLMEYVDGVNLRQVMAGGRMEPKQAMAIVPQICDALQYAHERGIVHRDIKPENILLSRDGVVKIADFGVAKILAGKAEKPKAESRNEDDAAVTDAKAVGTPAYMAPEQKERPGEVDHRADIYSLGVVFYQMLTGELPGKQIEAPSRKVQIDVRLDEVVLRALESEPARRYETAGVMRTEVETIAEGKAEMGMQNAEIGRVNAVSLRPARAALLAGIIVAFLVGSVAYVLLRPTFRAAGMLEWRPVQTRSPDHAAIQKAFSGVMTIIQSQSTLDLATRAMQREYGDTPLLDASHLRVSAVSGSYLMQVVYADPDPVIAARAATAIINTAADMHMPAGSLSIFRLPEVPDAERAQVDRQIRSVLFAIWSGLIAAVICWLRRRKSVANRIKQRAPGIRERRYEISGATKSRVETLSYATQQQQTRPAWHRFVAVVGTRGGKRVVNWQAVFLGAFAMGLLWLGGACVAVAQRGGGPPAMGWGWLIGIAASFSIVPTVVAIWMSFTRMPLERLVRLDDEEETRPRPEGGTRLSRAAIVGLFGAVTSALAACWLLNIEGQRAGEWNSMSSVERLGFVLTEALFVVGFLVSPLVTTILGWIAVVQIRRSAGRLRGLGLAVCDGVLFPLLALDGLLMWVSNGLFHYWREVVVQRAVVTGTQMVPVHTMSVSLTGLAATITAVLGLDLVIVWCVWRAVNKTKADANSPVESGTYFGTGRQLLLVLGGALLMACIGLAVWRAAFHTPAAGLPKSSWQARQLSQAFGPVTERVVGIGIDLRTGDMPQLELSSKGTLDERIAQGWKWMNRRGGDSLAFTGGMQLAGIGITSIALDRNQWDSITPSTLIARLGSARSAQPLQPTLYLGPPEMTETCGFQTSTGTVGLLQFVGEDPRGVRIRYKLVQSSATVESAEEAWRRALDVAAHVRPSAVNQEFHDILIPDVDDAARGHIPFILDLASGEMLRNPENVVGEEALRYYTQTGRGDLAYDINLIVFRGGKLVDAQGRSLTPTTVYADSPRYHLATLPSPVFVLTGDQRLFELRNVQPKGAFPNRVLHLRYAAAQPTTLPAQPAESPQLGSPASKDDNASRAPAALAPPLQAGVSETPELKALRRQKLEAAEARLRQAEGQFKAGLVSAVEPLLAKRDRDVAAAELEGDRLKMAQAQLTCAEQVAELQKKMFEAGFVEYKQYQDAVAELTKAKVEYERAKAASPTPHAQPGAATTQAAREADPGARIRLRDAEVHLARVEEVYKANGASPLEYEQAKLERDVAAAEIRGDQAEVARLKVEFAERRLQRVEELYKQEAASPLELDEAKLARDIAAAELRGDRVAVARARYEYAEGRLARAEELHQNEALSPLEYEQAKSARDLAKIEYERVKAAKGSDGVSSTQPAGGNPFVKRQRFESKAGMENQTNWGVIDKPSTLNPEGWTIMAHMSLGGVVPARLPGEDKEFCRIKMLDGNDDQITLQVEDVANRNAMIVRLNRDQYTEITVNGDRYRIVYPAVSVNLNEADTTPLALVIVTHADQKKAATTRAIDAGGGGNDR